MIRISILLTVSFVLFTACQSSESQTTTPKDNKEKYVVYQVFTRLFGNTNTTNKPWGTIEENGIGKFNDFTDIALSELKAMGITHMWYTGVPHHGVINDYSEFGISNDDPDVIKGRAGSPYAVKDYYNVNPDLAVDPAKRLEEFEELIERTHNNGMKVLIDIVPNHVARNYVSLSKPDSVSDFGANDDTSVEYSRDNDFYYIPGQDFEVPDDEQFITPLGGEDHPLADGEFDETPAKWTGNGSRNAKPMAWDWYETVKVNYGVKPDGSYDFDTLPKSYANKCFKTHFSFWQNKDVPSSWKKFRDIALYWLDKGVDGFRFDMAEMVPVEFWSYMNSSIKNANPKAFLLAEVYNPRLYRDYIHLGKMDYLYDKVELYDTLKHIMQGHGSTDNISAIQDGLADIEHHMLHFLENHDEQRIASAEFAGLAEKGKPAMVVSACISTSPTMLYFGQDVGEPGDNNAGFGTETRTTIFDYWGIPNHQHWMNNGKFDGGQLTTDEKDLRKFYKTLLSFTASNKAMVGDYKEIHKFNRENTENYNDKLFSFVRWKNDSKVIVVSNFDDVQNYNLNLKLSPEVIKEWKLTDGNYNCTDIFTKNKFSLIIENENATIDIGVGALESFILTFK